ncbi:universal stress protein [bacterium]|nr:universal stress protein [bacterium]
MPKATKQSARRRKPGTPVPAMRRLLVPTDFSAGSRRAVAHARTLLRGADAALMLVHVVMPVTSPDMIYGSQLWDQTQINRAAETAMKNWQTEVGLARERRVQTRVSVGIPWREINAAAAKFKADLIVISTHGRTGLSHYLLGSTAEQVVRHAICPVLVVRAPKSE